ncbi:hypothetical protein [Paenibacillus sp. BK720]|uniref:hypothetical protein n=1 Tax=Paenibacillus sp. BK720 TaxID=2587092 RepID=UPI00141ED935|nr:hypothetical protein [Paenibacillus sp. BK720]NIK70445.1 hypothetical protein [Paenibacillus sp. BK720]
MNKGGIDSEPAYVVTLLDRFDDIPLPYTLFHVRQTPEGAERELGVDAIMLFAKHIGSDIEYKVGMFEAKWVVKHNGNVRTWDPSKKTDLKLSRYTEQLQKQRQIPEGIAVWTMFINAMENLTRNKYRFHRIGATCLWHEAIWSYYTLGKMKFTTYFESWNTKDDLSCLFNCIRPFNFARTIQEILECNTGVPKAKDLTTNSITFDNRRDGCQGNLIIPIPDLSNGWNRNDIDEIKEFMRVHGLRDYYVIDFGNG